MTVASTASSAEAWAALTDSTALQQWFGVPDDELAPGAHVRLDFEDGDFFDLDVEEVARPRLRWSWRFMGCGPRDRIEIRVDARDGGSQITVTDREPHRSREEALGLGEGWRDFTSRLQRFLQTGQRSRYDWRSEVDVWTELPASLDDARRLLIGSASQWLPLSGNAENLLAADALVLADGEQPARFAVEDLGGEAPASVHFQLVPEGITGSLDTRIEIAARGNASTLAISQTGFRELELDDSMRRRIRERFAAEWLTAARRATALAERSRASTPAGVP